MTSKLLLITSLVLAISVNKALSQPVQIADCQKGESLNFVFQGDVLVETFCAPPTVVVPNCSFYLNNACQTCYQGYSYQRTTKSCLQCSADHCLSCSSNGQKCFKCEEGYQFNPVTYQCIPDSQLCPPGFGFNKEGNSCLVCQLNNCGNCFFNYSQCSACKQGFSFDNSTNQCLLIIQTD